MTEWTELKQRVLLDALKRIDNLGVQYKIIAPDGAEYGTLVAVQPKVKPVKERKRKSPKYAVGELKTYISSFVADLQPGNEVFVPVDKYDIQAIQSALAGHGFKYWGGGNYVTERDWSRNGVTILRVV